LRGNWTDRSTRMTTILAVLSLIITVVAILLR
jgi:hypothetical protein